MQRQRTPSQIIINNVLWFAGSMGLAFFIWVVATFQSDPITQRRFPAIPILASYDDALIITDQSRETATVTVRAPTSVISILDSNDITVQADLSGLGPGVHRVNLESSTTRTQTVTDTTPRQITITLETRQERLVPVETRIIAEPPRGFEISNGPVLSVNQVLVSGPESQVERVAAARVELDFTEQRTSLTESYQLTPINAVGDTVSGVMITPDTVEVTAEIQTRPGIREVRIAPEMLAETLPEGYALTDYSYNPDTILIGGPPDLLENLPSTIFTEPIDLTGRTNNFEQEVTPRLPDDALFVLGDESITVSIGITPLIASRQFDSIPVISVGQEENVDVALAPAQVTVLINGPQLVLEALQPEDLRVSINLSGLAPGNYQITPDVIIDQGQTPLNDISLLPPQIDVVISSEATEEAP